MSDKHLEEVLRAAAKSGRLNHVSIIFSEGVWKASYRGVEDRDFRFTSHPDVVCAMRSALTGKTGDVPPAEKPARPVKVKAPEVDVFGDLM